MTFIVANHGQIALLARHRYHFALDGPFDARYGGREQ